MELNQETLKKAYNYLSKDPCLDHLINKFSNNIDILERFNENYPLALAYLIIEQQVSFKAAITIKKRFIKKVVGLSNDEIIELKDKDLQSIGISYRKATYIRNVFMFFKDYKFDFGGASNQEVINELTKIKGIGAWSSEMFLMFVLMRINIFSKGDLALMNSIKINYKIDIKDESKVNYLVESWSPYKSVASLLLWKSIEEKYFYT
ncbi:MAG: DNA-3-methyladenine glycosylase family protein [Candidatus Marisimplicoccus sp.]